jgi:hypothetical protein
MSHANAYMLMYRRISAEDHIDIPVAAHPAPLVAPHIVASAVTCSDSEGTLPAATCTILTSDAAAALSLGSSAEPRPGFIRILRSQPSDGEIPPSVLDGIRAIEAAEKAAEEEAQKLREKVVVKVTYNGTQRSANLASTMSVKEATEVVWKLFGLSGLQEDAACGKAVEEAASAVGTQTSGDEDSSVPRVIHSAVPLDCVRLRKYSSYSDHVGAPLTYNPRPNASSHVLGASGSSDQCAIVPYTGTGSTAGWEPEVDEASYFQPPHPKSEASQAEAPLPPSGVPELEDGSQRTLAAAGVSQYYEELILETRSSATDPWPEYDADAISIKIRQVCGCNRVHSRLFVVRFHGFLSFARPCSTVGDGSPFIC